MPILDIHWAGAPPASPDDMAAALADAIGDALQQPPGRVWVRLHLIHHAENGGPLAGAQPVFVTLMHAHPPTGDALRAEVMAVTQAVAQASGRPRERVHLEYAAPGAGRMAFGGRLVE
jgi:phenylpyruvate tautomerase PptA (4-oxalocrotonate tautomerase family)